MGDLVDRILKHGKVARELENAFPPVESDLRRLLHLLEQMQPKSILEYGSGWSTVLMAAWAASHEGVFLETLESDPIWYCSTMNALNADRSLTQRFVDNDYMDDPLRVADHAEKERWRLLFSPTSNGSTEASVYYIQQHLTAPDFIYIDGPALWGKCKITENPLVMLDTSRPMVFLVDGRFPMAHQLYSTYNDKSYYWLCATGDHNVSLVFHEDYSAVGKWFVDNVQPCKMIMKKESK